MLKAQVKPRFQVIEALNTYPAFPIAIEIQPDPRVAALVAKLSPETPWGDRQTAAQKLGRLGDPEALTALLDALLSDPFWMVRCAIIQALEMIGDPKAIPTLRKVVNNDGFQMVRSYARKAIERLSPGL